MNEKTLPQTTDTMPALDTLSNDLKAANDMVNQTGNAFVVAYWNLGHLLGKAKAKLPHGQFRPFHQAQGISKDRATRAMNLVNLYPEKSQLATFESMTAALGTGSQEIEYEAHPYAEIFPDMQPHEFIGLVESIRDHGLLSPIALWRETDEEDWQIIDGRQRYRACKEAGVKPQYVFLGADVNPLEYTIGCNIHRGQWNESQLAMATAKML